MEHERNLLTNRLGRRRLLTLGAASLFVVTTSIRTDAHDPTSTPAPGDAGAPDASPAGSPMASPVASGPIFESTIQALKFVPHEIDIEVGTTVIWTNEDMVPHTVTHKVKVEDQLFASPYMVTGDTFTYTFEKPGDYLVFCLPHPFMTQTVVVSKKK